MKYTLANIAFFLGVIGFVSILFLIVAGVLGCCANISGKLFNDIISWAIILAALTIIGCVGRNCYYRLFH